VNDVREEVDPLRRALAEALHELARTALDAGQAEQGAALIARAISLYPNVAQAHANLGFALSLLGRFEEAETHYGRAIILQPEFAQAHYNRGVMRDALQRYEDAIISYDEAIKLAPLYAEAHANRANSLHDLKRFEEALESHMRATKLAPSNADFRYNLGNALCALGRNDEAVDSFNAAVALNPTHASAYCNLGIALNELGDRGAALLNFDQAIMLKPNFAEAHSNRAVTLTDMKRFDEALAACDRAILLNPESAKSHYGRGVVLNELRRFEDALASYTRAVTLAPKAPFLLGKLIHMKMSICDWHGLDELSSELERRIAQGEPASPPFQTLAIFDAPDLHRKAAEIYASTVEKTVQSVPQIISHSRYDKIRLGYFSADFHDHATANLMAELFERHNRALFELSAFSFGPKTNDPMRQRIRAAFDQFLEVGDLTNDEVALLAREHQIDIAVDLKGYTGDGRPGIFARRAAPIQVSHLGYPGTMGSAFIDYLIADKTIIPRGEFCHYSEKIVTLPDTYQANESVAVVAEQKISRAEAGLPEGAFVFCCFNNNYKITPDVFGRWMRILNAVDQSVFWLLEDNARAVTNLRAEAKNRGIAPERLIFAVRTTRTAHLARHRLADLFLDTIPYNAHTTASDALRMGLPVLTMRGRSFASRVAASLLKAIELPELITMSAVEYEEMAIGLAQNPRRLEAIREKIVQNRLAAPLFNAARFTRMIETAYGKMYERYHSGLSPDHIDVETI
jgi:predicted O-linked N-acetylglucosamine transferase (SPINDLY family)